MMGDRFHPSTEIVTRTNAALKRRLLIVLAALTVTLVAAGAPAVAAESVTAEEIAEAFESTSGEPFTCPDETVRLDDIPDDEELKRKQACLRGMLAKQPAPEARAALLFLAAETEEALGNVEQAMRDVEAAFGTGALTKTEKADGYLILARLHLKSAPPDRARAIGKLRKYMELKDNPTAEAYFLLASAQALNGECRKSVPNAQKAIELAEEPSEDHYRTLLYCYSKLEDHESVVSLAERMLARFSVRNEYLAALAHGYLKLGRERDAFMVQAFRYELGYLKSEQELLGIANLYLVYDNPARAARILQKEIDAGRVRPTARNLARLGDMWFLAREHKRALASLKRAAEKSGDGEIDYRIGQTHFVRDEWADAETHFRRALRKGGLAMPCKARVLLAHALYNRDRRDEAMKEFKRAAQSDACAKEAGEWARYLSVGTIVDGPKPEHYEFKVKLTLEWQKSVFALPEYEKIRAHAADALEAAKEAHAAESRTFRQHKLADYERARNAAMQGLNEWAPERAELASEVARKLALEAPQKDLSEEEKAQLRELLKTANRGVALIEAAQDDLRMAEKFAAKAREKDEKAASAP